MSPLLVFRRIVLPQVLLSSAPSIVNHNLDFGVDYEHYAMPHSVCPQEVADINRWLLTVLA